MFTSHAYQCISLQLDAVKGAEIEIKQLRPIGAKEPMEARFRMFVKSASGNPVKFIKVMLGDKELKLAAVEDETRANGDWYELRSYALPVAPGTYNFRIVVTNPGDALTLNFDELRLRLKSINRVTK